MRLRDASPVWRGGVGKVLPALDWKSNSPAPYPTTFTDGHGIGRMRLIGKRKIETFPLAHIKRVRILKRADGYYVQFAVQTARTVPHEPTGRQIGIDVGLKAFYTDSDGTVVPNPRFLRSRSA